MKMKINIDELQDFIYNDLIAILNDSVFYRDDLMNDSKFYQIIRDFFSNYYSIGR